MMKSSIITVTLIALCAGLGWTAYEQAQRPLPLIDGRVRDAGAETGMGQGKSEQEKTAIILPPLDAFGDIVSRPLFNVSRRPIAVEKTVPDAKPAELNLMLSGIVIGQTGQIAHLRSAADKQTQALGVGDKIGDWQIQSIFPDRVVLQSGGRVETLFMQKPGAGNRASTPSRAAPGKPFSRRGATSLERRARRIYGRTKRPGEQ
jgi:hypothetical protein